METQNFDGSQHFVHYLQNELIRRCRDNTNYSMRSFARQLGVNQSLLSKILRGKKAISEKMVLELSKILKVPKGDMMRFLSNDQAAAGFNRAQMLRDQFELLSDWYHFAILELTHLKHFKPDAKWIATTLGISVLEANMAIDRLVRNGFIKIHLNGKWQIFKPHNNWTNRAVTTSAQKIYQRQVLERAIQAIKDVDFDFRHNTSMTLSVNARLMPKFKELLDNYRDEFTEYAEQQDSYTDVYQLCMAFFPLTDADKKRSKK
jgi:uncharacterized protein (TIGR02147 family)